ncbi:hypothetical protein A2999_02025 [Candidatus Wolfebacteria bacterium RIFCSPLOWO2_01_FULL_38_11]|uniref:Uncharacterized protein n=1 Tax=Candidatus Wolfebacteria bacterium RIFCSPLOWO2_01_FULL_38_11 TaxID=1802556 RepID=A0A1F8DRQ8_9BACT|nr:MAG: hypothetical protein A2999_02025 [Candidatus Wolfebacteria bacterium RIFCSPLOWO2_01_FULL_38_11]
MLPFVAGTGASFSSSHAGNIPLFIATSLFSVIVPATMFFCSGIKPGFSPYKIFKETKKEYI